LISKDLLVGELAHVYPAAVLEQGGRDWGMVAFGPSPVVVGAGALIRFELIEVDDDSLDAVLDARPFARARLSGARCSYVSAVVGTLLCRGRAIGHGQSSRSAVTLPLGDALLPGFVLELLVVGQLVRSSEDNSLARGRLGAVDFVAAV
jgi:hypothetical protein